MQRERRSSYRRGDQLLTVNQACSRLAISKSLLRNEMQKRRLTVVRIGRKLFIPINTCDELVRLGVCKYVAYFPGFGR